MSGEKKREGWLPEFLAVEPGGPDWKIKVRELGRRFGGLDPEDQVAAVERLAKFAESPEARETASELYEKSESSLPALAALARLGSELGLSVPAGLVIELTEWLTLCESDEGSCAAQKFAALPARAQAAVVDHLARWLRADLLVKLNEAQSDKAVAKMLKKALHRVRSAGVTIQGEGGAVMVMADREQELTDEAYLTPPDAAGATLVFLYRTIFGKNNLAALELSDHDGVVRFESYETPRPRFERILDATHQNPHAILIKVDPGYVRLLIKKAEETGRKHGKLQAREYLSNRRLFGVADEPPAPHPVWTQLSEADLKQERGLAFTSGELCAHRMFADWRLLPLDEGPFLAELQNLRTSPLELTPEQQREREDRFLESEAVKLVEETGREVWRDRMLACAYLLFLAGEEKTARMAAAVGLTVADPLEPLPRFFVEILEHSLGEAIAPEEGGEPAPLPDRGGMVVV